MDELTPRHDELYPGREVFSRTFSSESGYSSDRCDKDGDDSETGPDSVSSDEELRLRCSGPACFHLGKTMYYGLCFCCDQVLTSSNRQRRFQSNPESNETCRFRYCYNSASTSYNGMCMSCFGLLNAAAKKRSQKFSTKGRFSDKEHTAGHFRSDPNIPWSVYFKSAVPTKYLPKRKRKRKPLNMKTSTRTMHYSQLESMARSTEEKLTPRRLDLPSTCAGDVRNGNTTKQVSSGSDSETQELSRHNSVFSGMEDETTCTMTSENPASEVSDRGSNIKSQIEGATNYSYAGSKTSSKDKPDSTGRDMEGYMSEYVHCICSSPVSLESVNSTESQTENYSVQPLNSTETHPGNDTVLPILSASHGEDLVDYSASSIAMHRGEPGFLLGGGYSHDSLHSNGYPQPPGYHETISRTRLHGPEYFTFDEKHDACDLSTSMLMVNIEGTNLPKPTNRSSSYQPVQSEGYNLLDREPLISYPSDSVREPPEEFYRSHHLSEHQDEVFHSMEPANVLCHPSDSLSISDPVGNSISSHLVNSVNISVFDDHLDEDTA